TIGPGPGGRVPGIEFGGTGPAFGPPARTSGTRIQHRPYMVRVSSAALALKLEDLHGALAPDILQWQRTLSAAREVRQPEVIQRKTKGPSFGLPHLKLTPPLSPGPQNYHPCDGACVACDSYHGKSMGLRPPMFYGKVTTVSPGPHYHVECSTLGAATQNCATGSSTFRRPKQTSPVTQPFSRKPYCPDGTC
ncbi:hypothetical protein QJQ45_018100, partial [Haematococcus lacustris]